VGGTQINAGEKWKLVQNGVFGGELCPDKNDPESNCAHTILLLLSPFIFVRSI